VDRRLAAALTQLGLTATEAEIYVALLQRSQDGPISAYKLAQAMGRDPANTSKTLGAMAKSGSVHASGRQPRLYQAAAPSDVTGEMVARVQARQREALELLAALGKPPAGAAPRSLETTEAGLDAARRLLGEATSVVLVDASPELLLALASDLERLAEQQAASVLVRSSAPAAVRGARVLVDRRADEVAPGPWLRLAVDGRACLEMVVHPDRRDQLLHGQWSRNASQAFLAHRSLIGELATRHAGGSSRDLERERPPAPDGEEAEQDDGGPLKFVFRHPRKDGD
jgi:sugar-specific transcriptional regulator TrmB